MPILGVDCRGRRGDGRLDEILVLFWVLVGGIAGGRLAYRMGAPHGPRVSGAE